MTELITELQCWLRIGLSSALRVTLGFGIDSRPQSPKSSDLCKVKSFSFGLLQSKHLFFTVAHFFKKMHIGSSGVVKGFSCP